MRRFRLSRDEYVALHLKNAAKISDKNSNAVAYVYTATNGRPAATIFLGKADKPFSRYWYSTEKSRESAIKSAFDSQWKHEQSVAERRSTRKNWVPNYKVGDIFYTNWGYDQTNVEYFQIVEIKGKFATLREIGGASETTASMQGRSTPLPDNFLKPRYEGDDRGLPIKRLMQERGIKIDNVRWAWKSEPTEEVPGVKVHRSHSWSSYA